MNDIERLQRSEAQEALNNLLRNLMGVRKTFEGRAKTAREVGQVEGLNIAIAAIKRRIR